MTAQTILPANSATTATGYNVTNSLRFNESDDCLIKTFGSAGNRKLWTYSVWFKRGKLGGSYALFVAGASGNDEATMRVEADKIDWQHYDKGTNSTDAQLLTSQLIRDPSAWYHLVCAYDSANSTAGDRMKMFLNGSEITSFSTDNNPSLNYDSAINNNVLHNIGRQSWNSSADFSGYMAEICFIDGAALAPTSFGEFDEDSGIWKPIDVSELTFGGNGFYLPFENSAALGQDDSGETNNWTVNNLTAIDQTTDTPTNNFATLNGVALNNNTGANYITLSEGNLKAVGTSASNNGNAFSTIGFSSGKWYCEVKMVDADTSLFPCVGVITESSINNSTGNNGTIGQVTSDTVGYSPDGEKVIGGTESSYGDTFTNNDIIGIAIDCDNGAVYFSKNGTFQASGDPTSGASKTNAAMTFTPSKYYFFGGSVYQSTNVIEFNFGNPTFTGTDKTDGNSRGSFEYAPPSGFLSLCTANLSESG